MHTYAYIRTCTYRHTVCVYQYSAIMLLWHIYWWAGKPHFSSPQRQLLYTQEQSLRGTMGRHMYIHTCVHGHTYTYVHVQCINNTVCTVLYAYTYCMYVCMHIVPCVQVLHDNQNGQPSLPPWGLHQGDHHQLHRHLVRTGGPAPQVGCQAPLGSGTYMPTYVRTCGTWLCMWGWGMKDGRHCLGRERTYFEDPKS